MWLTRLFGLLLALGSGLLIGYLGVEISNPDGFIYYIGFVGFLLVLMLAILGLLCGTCLFAYTVLGRRQTGG